MKILQPLYSILIYLIVLFNYFYLKANDLFLSILSGYIHIDHHSFTGSDLTKVTIYLHGTNYFIKCHPNNILRKFSDPDRAQKLGTIVV